MCYLAKCTQEHLWGLMRTGFMVLAFLGMAFTAEAADNITDESKDDLKGAANYYFQKMDSNKDNYISKDEQMKFNDAMFSKSDKDRDGRISAEEFAQGKYDEREELRKATFVKK